MVLGAIFSSLRFSEKLIILMTVIKFGEKITTAEKIRVSKAKASDMSYV